MPEQIQVNNIESIRESVWHITCKNMDYFNKNVYKNKVIMYNYFKGLTVV